MSEFDGSWSVFNSGGACIVEDVKYALAADYMTEDRFARGWTMVSVIKSMADLAAPPVDAVPGEPVARECTDPMCACRGGPCAECPEGQAIAASVASRAGSEPVAPVSAFDSVSFNDAVRKHAALRYKTMKEVSAATGVSETTLSRMQQGRRPDAASLAALSAWAGINPAHFMHSTGVEARPTELPPEVLLTAPIAPAAAAEPSEWYEKHKAECTKDYGEYDESASIATRLRWWVPKSARHGRLQLEDDLLEAVEVLADRAGVASLVASEDTKRYRWLRTHSFFPGADGHPRTIYFGAGFNQSKPELLDEAIDRASAGEAQS